MNTSTESCYQRVSCKAKKRKTNCSKMFLAIFTLKNCKSHITVQKASS